MKKMKSLMFLTLIPFTLAVTSCGEKQLDTPTVSVSGVKENNDIYNKQVKVSWNAVENAESYIVRVGGTEIEVTDTYYLFDPSAVTSEITVSAKSSNEKLLESEKSSVVTATRVGNADISISNKNNEISWPAVEDATGYTIYINGEKASTQTTTKYDLGARDYGIYKVEIVTSTSKENYYDSLTTYEVTYAQLSDVNIKLSDDNKISWESVDNAEGYYVYLNNELVSTQTTTSYAYSRNTLGSDTIKVEAYSTHPRYDNSSAEYKYVVTNKGYLYDKAMDFSKYENTSAYRKVSTFEQLLDAISDAKSHYTSTITEVIGDSYIVRNNCEKSETNWKNALAGGLYEKVGDSYVQIPVGTAYPGNTYYNTNKKDSKSYYEKSSISNVKYTQGPADGYNESNYKGTVHVIEIENDLELGWNHIPEKYKSSTTYAQSWGDAKKDPLYTKSSMYEEHGITKIKIENTNDLLIYSKNGAKITHAGFSVSGCDNVAFRNLELDEMWQWEDASAKTTAKVGDFDAYGWAYFKIGFCGSVLIDHCTFGKSFDGQIDISNPTYTTKGTLFRAPLGADGSSQVQISNCKFLAGSDDPNGYIYKMMEEIEADYQAGGDHYLYYKALRDGGLSFNEVLYGVAIPQKKAFLDGDSGDEYTYNTNLRVSIGNCYFKNIEDRLPKVRGGVAYMYNTIIDNSEYYSYREILTTKDAGSMVSNVNSSWKCALVSQGIVCGLGGSVYAENCRFIGIKYLLKNNDNTLTNKAENPEATLDGGYKLINCEYKETATSTVITSNFPNATGYSLKEEFFKFRTTDGNKPFVIVPISLSELEGYISTNAGPTASTADWFTI